MRIILLSLVTPIACLSNGGNVVRSRVARQSPDSSMEVPNDPADQARLYSRRNALSSIAVGSLLMISSPESAVSFEGGVGGLGKTRPETGVAFFPGSEPIQQNGGVSAELLVGNEAVLVGFDAPFPLLPTTAGLETRDLQSSESAFVQVIENRPMPTSTAGFQSLLLDTVLSSKGKFGAYGSPTDVKVKKLVLDEATGLLCYAVTFTTLTPGQRESERQMYIRSIAVKNNVVLLIAGTTRLRFKAQEPVLRQAVASFSAVPAPPSQLKR